MIRSIGQCLTSIAGSDMRGPLTTRTSVVVDGSRRRLDHCIVDAAVYTTLKDKRAVEDLQCHVSLSPDQDAVLVPTFVFEHVIVPAGQCPHIHHLAIVVMKSALAVYRQLGLTVPVLGGLVTNGKMRLVVGVPAALRHNWSNYVRDVPSCSVYLLIAFYSRTLTIVPVTTVRIS